LKTRSVIVAEIVWVMVVQMGWDFRYQIPLLGALIICVWCIHLCCKSVRDSKDMLGLAAENQ
jgi:hypothetical protein